MADPRQLNEHLLAWTVADLLDEDGRPLGELASARYGEIATEVVACPWAGARQGLPMNRSALRQLTACWPALVGSIAWLAGPSPTVHRAWWAATAATVAPLVRHLADPAPIPRVLSALYKTSLGFTQVLTAILLADEVADLPLAELGDAGAFLRFLDDGRWLVGDEQACAGPPARIGALLDALAGRASPAPAPDLTALGEPGWADHAATSFALQAATVAAGYQALRRGDREGLREPLEGWLTRPRAPALRAILSVPDRDPGDVRRLFPTGSVPAPVERFLDEGPGSPGALLDRLGSYLDAISAPGGARARPG